MGSNDKSRSDYQALAEHRLTTHKAHCARLELRRSLSDQYRSSNELPRSAARRAGLGDPGRWISQGE